MTSFEGPSASTAGAEKVYRIECPECKTRYRKKLEKGVVHRLVCGECNAAFDFNADAPH